MAYRALDLTLISAKDLKNVNLISNLHVYAVVSLSGDPRTQQRTPTDRHGGHNPVWNHTCRFMVPTDANSTGRLSIHVVLRAERMLGDRDLGEIYIPLKDLMSTGDQTARFASYQIRKISSGKSRGVLNISYKLGDQLATPTMFQPQEPVTAYPAPLPRYEQPYPAPDGRFGYPPPNYGYGYGYGHPQQLPVQQGRPNRNNFGMGLGAGLLGGALGGLLVGDMISDAGAYDAGYDAGFDDAGGMDGGFDGGFYF